MPLSESRSAVRFPNVAVNSTWKAWQARVPASVRRDFLVAAVASLLVLVIWLAVPNEIGPLIFPAVGFGALFIARRPDLAASVLLFLNYFKLDEIASWTSPLGHANTAFSALVVAAMLWHVATSQIERVNLWGAPMLVLALWLLLTFGVPLAFDRSIAYDSWFQYSKLLLLAIGAILFIRTEQNLYLLSLLFVIGGTIIAASTVLNFWRGLILVDGSRAAAGGGFLSNPNDVAMLLLLPLCFAAVMALSRIPPWERLFGLAATAVILLAMVYCRSRGSLFAMVGLYLVIGSHFVRSKTKLLGMGAAVIVMIYLSMDISSRTSGGTITFEDDSAMGRIHAWTAAINMALAQPLTGVGIGNFHANYFRYSPVTTGPDLTAHSNWFLILGEGGWPGLLLFVGIIMASISRSARNLRMLNVGPINFRLQGFALSILAGLIAFVIGGTFSAYVFQWPLYVLIAATVAVSGLIENKNLSR